MLTIRRFQKGDEEILSIMIRRTLREVNYTSPKSELDYLIPYYSPDMAVEFYEHMGWVNPNGPRARAGEDNLLYMEKRK